MNLNLRARGQALLNEAAKKGILLVVRPLRPSPPLLELSGHRNFFLVLKLITENGF